MDHGKRLSIGRTNDRAMFECEVSVVPEPGPLRPRGGAPVDERMCVATGATVRPRGRRACRWSATARTWPASGSVEVPVPCVGNDNPAGRQLRVAECWPALALRGNSAPEDCCRPMIAAAHPRLEVRQRGRCLCVSRCTTAPVRWLPIAFAKCVRSVRRWSPSVRPATVQGEHVHQRTLSDTPCWCVGTRTAIDPRIAVTDDDLHVCGARAALCRRLRAPVFRRLRVTRGGRCKQAEIRGCELCHVVVFTRVGTWAVLPSITAAGRAVAGRTDERPTQEAVKRAVPVERVVSGIGRDA